MNRAEVAAPALRTVGAQPGDVVRLGCAVARDRDPHCRERTAGGLQLTFHRARGIEPPARARSVTLRRLRFREAVRRGRDPVLGEEAVQRRVRFDPLVLAREAVELRNRVYVGLGADEEGRLEIAGAGAE